jgi:hypothetical protein
MREHLEARLRIITEVEGPMLYCEIKEGKHYKPIAKRPPGKYWINLEPGYVVSGGGAGGDYSTICIDYVGVH